jgi:hypothetical protein
MKQTYRGFTILYHPADEWLAFIYPPGAVEATGSTTRATRKEGENVLLKRVRAKIDAELDGKDKAAG